MFKSFRRRLCAFAIAAAGLIGTAQAAPLFSDVVFFGDSLSDTGNVLSLTRAAGQPLFPSFPGAQGRFSNGPVWTEYLATGLGMPGKSNPSNLLFNGTSVIPIGPQGGQNFSYGGARTGLSGAAGLTTGLFGQLIAWNGSAFGTSLTRPADPNALYVVLAGANDLRSIRSGVAGTPSGVAANVTKAVGLLAQAGARHFLVSNLPDLGKTPEAAYLGQEAYSTALTLQFNGALDAYMAALDSLFLGTFGVDLDIRSMDLFGLWETVLSDPLAFGITNVGVPCITPGPGSGQYFFADATDSGNCSVSAFSDPLHPSALGHALIGQLALQAVPEPESVPLVMAAIILLGLVRSRSAA